jgi:hypothetical protein
LNAIHDNPSLSEESIGNQVIHKRKDVKNPVEEKGLEIYA